MSGSAVSRALRDRFEAICRSGLARLQRKLDFGWTFLRDDSDGSSASTLLRRASAILSRRIG